MLLVKTSDSIEDWLRSASGSCCSQAEVSLYTRAAVNVHWMCHHAVTGLVPMDSDSI